MDEIKITIDNYDLLIVNKKRYYLQDLTVRDYILENSTPYILRFNDYEFRETTWIELLRNLAAYLITEYPDKILKIYDFQTKWSKAIIFSNKQRTNFRKINENLYINGNHTALHSCWLVQDLLEYFNINTSNITFYIHRPSSIEPKIVKEYLLNKAHKEFSLFLKYEHNKDDEQAKKIIQNISNHLNKILQNISKSYDEVFLFGDYQTFYNYIKRISESMKKDQKYDEKSQNILNRYIKYLIDFYKL